MTEKKKYKHSMTFRQRHFVKEVLEKGKIGAAAEAAGLTPTYGSKLMTNPKIQKALQSAMEKEGITDEKLAKTVAEGLGATTPPVEGGKRGGGRPSWPDFGVRREYLDLACKVRGDYAPEVHEEKSTRLEITVDLNTLTGMVESGVLNDDEIIEVSNLEAKALRDASGRRQMPQDRKSLPAEGESTEEQQ